MSLMKIVPFSDVYQADVDVLMREIAKEFAVPISISAGGTEPKKMKESALLDTDMYWVALSDGKTAGTIGLRKIADRIGVLKSMFVGRDFRGTGTAQLLLDTLLIWAVENKFKAIDLGTMDQFKAAHKFYERNGFKEIHRSFLPADFPVNPVDTVFYRKELM